MKYAILSEYSFRKLLKVLTQGFLTVKAIVTIFWKFHLHNSSVPWLTWQHFVLGNLQCTSHDTHVPSHTAKHVQEPPACAGFAEFFKGSILHLHLILVFFLFFLFCFLQTDYSRPWHCYQKNGVCFLYACHLKQLLKRRQSSHTLYLVGKEDQFRKQIIFLKWKPNQTLCLSGSVK